MSSPGPKKVSEAMRKKIELADQALAESHSIEQLMDECKENFGLAAKIMIEIKRGKFKKIEIEEIQPQDLDYVWLISFDSQHLLCSMEWIIN